MGDRRTLASRLAEESPELPARGIERSLVIFAAMIEKRAAVLNHPVEGQVHWLVSQRRIKVQVADELPAQCPHVINVFLDGLRR